MTYPDALDHLGQARRFGMKLGLDCMRELAQALGTPQEGLRFLHIAGTNGKGSTAAFCESCLRSAGFRVGLYTSPHLVSIRERIQINRELISETAFAEGMEIVCAAAGRGQSEPAFFELMTALALWYFAREKVDWVVWETGLGGRLDATNIVTPELCVITNIGLEHQQYLGSTLAQIAAEKAGILKPGVPVITAVEDGAAADVILGAAQAAGAHVTRVAPVSRSGIIDVSRTHQIARIDGDEFVLGLLGAHQVANAACAVAAMRLLHLGDAASLARGLESTEWPGRFQIASERPLVVLDGAHNPSGAQILAETWKAFLRAKPGGEERASGRAHLVFACADDKDVAALVEPLRSLARNVILVRLESERSADPARVADHFDGLPVSFCESAAEAWRQIDGLGDGEVTLVTGSLFLVGEMLAHRFGGGKEYRLNERLKKSASR